MSFIILSNILYDCKFYYIREQTTFALYIIILFWRKLIFFLVPLKIRKVTIQFTYRSYVLSEINTSVQHMISLCIAPNSLLFVLWVEMKETSSIFFLTIRQFYFSFCITHLTTFLKNVPKSSNI